MSNHISKTVQFLLDLEDALAELIDLLPSIVLFFFSQRIFTQGVVFSGIKG